jgi:serine protease Do
MRLLAISLILATAWTSTPARAESRFIVDDDAYADQVVRAAEKLRHEHKLLAFDTLRSQVHTKGFALKLLPPSQQALQPPDLCDRLRESTLAVGTFYKCPDCGSWHFSGSAGFVVNESGVVCTCCHVLLEEDAQIKESYLVAADAYGHVFPVLSVLAADTEADTCLIRINATGLRPLPLRAGSRPGETVYCLSHPGGYYFMFTQGMIARLNRRTNAETDEHGQVKGTQSRPILLLNITAEFAPGSSGAAVVDVCGNVVGQVASIGDAGASPEDQPDKPASPSVPIRFCTATEEILRLLNANLAKDSPPGSLVPAKSPKPKLRRVGSRLVCPRPQAKATER